MPWTAKDVPGKTKKATTAKRKRQWVDVANSALKRTGNEATAIKMANGVVAKQVRKRKR